MIELTPHSDILISGHAAEGVRQGHRVPSCIISGWPVDHQATFFHRVVQAVYYLVAIEEPHLLLRLSLFHAVLQSESVSSLSSKIRP